ncbi:MAG: hypothetical protein U0M06_02620 [Clostridia bacterium]|nr:hypothetical protein [Clostridia bacterium]
MTNHKILLSLAVLISCENLFGYTKEGIATKSITGGTYSSVFVSVPKNAKPESLGIYVRLMGAGVRSTVSQLSL